MGDKIYFNNMIISIATENCSKTKKNKNKTKRITLHVKHAINPNSRKRCTQILIRATPTITTTKSARKAATRETNIFFDHFEL